MKIVVLGGAGYIGSVLCPYLLERGHIVTVYDIAQDKSEDIRNLDKLIPFMEKADAIIHLAGLPNDVLSDKNPQLTWDVNYKASEPIATLCKKVVYASSCSVYGFSSEEFSENSRLNPQTLYAKTKMLSEDLFKNAVKLRLATVYGSSPKPRYDLVVNKMLKDARDKGKIIANGGQQWRPVVHVRDVAIALEMALRMKSGVYNVGSNEQNYQIKNIAKIIGKETGAEIVTTDSLDTRSYKVNFDKIATLGFKFKYTIKNAIYGI